MKRPMSGKAAQGPAPYAPLSIESHQQLATKQREIFRRLNAHPEIASLLFINPVMAFKELGISLSPELGTHVLHAIRHPPATSKRRAELETRLTEALGEVPQPDDAKWTAHALFDLLELAPLDTADRQPAYRSPLPPAALERLQKLRPKLRRLRPEAARVRGTAVRVAPWRSAFRRLDLDAPLPQLEVARDRPSEVSLEQLYFYKDSHPTVRALLELAVLQRRGFPVHTPDSYRRIKAGERPNAFQRWITNVHFGPRTRRE